MSAKTGGGVVYLFGPQLISKEERRGRVKNKGEGGRFTFDTLFRIQRREREDTFLNRQLLHPKSEEEEEDDDDEEEEKGPGRG